MPTAIPTADCSQAMKNYRLAVRPDEAHRTERHHSGGTGVCPRRIAAARTASGDVGKAGVSELGILFLCGKAPKLTKTAWGYLPYGYDGSKQYNILYLSHGGWSHETTPMVTPDNPQQS